MKPLLKISKIPEITDKDIRLILEKHLTKKQAKLLILLRELKKDQSLPSRYFVNKYGWSDSRTCELRQLIAPYLKKGYLIVDNETVIKESED